MLGVLKPCTLFFCRSQIENYVEPYSQFALLICLDPKINSLEAKASTGTNEIVNIDRQTTKIKYRSLTQTRNQYRTSRVSCEYHFQCTYAVPALEIPLFETRTSILVLRALETSTHLYFNLCTVVGRVKTGRFHRLRPTNKGDFCLIG